MERRGMGAKRPTRPPAALLALLGASLLAAPPAASQVPTPSPSPPEQDQLDLQGRSSVVLGSGARAFGMGGAFLARADDATAASWNPAGLSYLRKPEVSLVGARNSSSASSRNGAGTLPGTDDFVGYSPDFLAATHPMHIRSMTGAVQLSFQRVISFSGDRALDRPDLQRHFHFEGGFDVVAFGAGLLVTRNLRLGATINHWGNGYRQTLDRRTSGRSSLQTADFTLAGWNTNIGLIWSPTENLNLGAVAKTSFTGDVTLTRSRQDFFGAARDNPDLVTKNTFFKNDIALDFPGAVGVGLSWRVRSALTVSADYTRTSWSKARVLNYFTLRATPPGQEAPVPRAPDDIFASLPYPTINDPVQIDTEQARAGLEYVIFSEHLRVPVRIGYFNDSQYFRSGTGGTPRLNGLTTGAGVIMGPVLMDVAYVYEHGSYDDPDAAGALKSVSVRRLFASLIFRFGASH